MLEGQAERLHYLIEECAEVQQAATKCLRHGFGSVNPLGDGRRDNCDDLERELADLSVAMERLFRAQDVDKGRVIALTTAKWEDPSRDAFFHCQEEYSSELIPGDEGHPDSESFAPNLRLVVGEDAEANPDS